MKKAVKMAMLTSGNRNHRYDRNDTMPRSGGYDMPYRRYDNQMPNGKFIDDKNNYGYEGGQTYEAWYDPNIHGPFHRYDERSRYPARITEPHSGYHPIGFDTRGGEETYDRYVPPIYNKHQERYGEDHSRHGEGEYYLNARFQMNRAQGGDKSEKLDRQTAQEWVDQMSKPDKSGAKGGKWTYDQTTQLLKDKNLDLDPVTFFVVMNMLYSDYGKTLVKHGMNNVDLYIDMAKDWIEDDDVAAGKAKTADYYYCIVK